MATKIPILFLCTGNSCRSQMAEGLANSLCGDFLQAYSAGTNPHTLNPYAVAVMKELGIDISGNYPKSIEALGDKKFSYVVTVCDDAHESCPFWPGRGKVIHRGFDDPPRLAAGLSDEQEILDVYRRVRDEIKGYVKTLPKVLTTALQD